MLERQSSRLDSHRQYHGCTASTHSDIEQLSAVTTPPWSQATIGRHLPLAAPVWERSYIDLRASGFGGRVREPFPIRRDLSILLQKLRVEEGNGLSIASQRKHPEIGTGLRIIDLVHERLPVRGPALWLDDLRGLEEQLLASRAVGCLLIDSPFPLTQRGKRDAAAVTGPDRR